MVNKRLYALTDVLESLIDEHADLMLEDIEIRKQLAGNEAAQQEIIKQLLLITGKADNQAYEKGLSQGNL